MTAERIIWLIIASGSVLLMLLGAVELCRAIIAGELTISWDDKGR